MTDLDGGQYISTMWVGASAPTLSDYSRQLQSVGAETPTHMIFFYYCTCFFITCKGIKAPLPEVSK
jgi:hypothetical protein